MNQALDAGLEFDESSELHQARDSAAHAIASLVLFRNGIPGMGLELLQTNGNALLLGLRSDLEHFHFDLLAPRRARPRAC